VVNENKGIVSGYPHGCLKFHILKLLNFVLFVTFVVKFAFSSLVAATPRWGKNIRVKLHPPGIVTSQERFGDQTSFL
jgi:hypothetical protein